jgi:hypothetical protein
MPGMNGTGPAGQGPMTGNGRGRCVSDDGGVIRRFFDRGLGMGGGRGSGRGRGLGLGRGSGVSARRWWQR